MDGNGYVEAADDTEIMCPYCGTINDDSDYIAVTPWGSEITPHLMLCEHCDKEFECHEYVTRTYKTKRLEVKRDG